MSIIALTLISASESASRKLGFLLGFPFIILILDKGGASSSSDKMTFFFPLSLAPVCALDLVGTGGVGVLLRDLGGSSSGSLSLGSIDLRFLPR